MINIQSEEKQEKRGINAPSKFYVLAGVTTLLGFVSSFSLSRGLYAQGAILLVLFLTVFIVNVLLVYTKQHITIGVAANSVAFAIPFLGLFSLYFVIGFAILFFLLLGGAYRARSDMDNMVKIKFAHLVRVISRSAITAVLVFLSVVVILSSNFSVSRGSIDRVLEISSPVIDRFINGFNSNANTGELLADFVEAKLEKDQNYISLPLRERNLVIAEQVDALIGRIEESTGVAINPEGSVSENLYEIIDTKLSSLTPKMQLYWSALLIAILWLSVQSVGFVIHIPLAALVFLIYEFLFAVKFATLQMETRSKEVISLK